MKLPIAGKETDAGQARYCPACNQTMENNTPDACLGNLPNVFAACCGHGETMGYIGLGDPMDPVIVRFDNTIVVERDKTIRVLKEVNGDLPGLYQVKLIKKHWWSKFLTVEYERVKNEV